MMRGTSAKPIALVDRRDAPSMASAHTLGRSVEDALAAADPKLGHVIAAVIARNGPQQITPSRITSPFEALARAIVYQSVSGKAAVAIFSRLRERVGRPFSPAKVLAITDRSILAVGLSKGKTRAIRNLAEWFAANPKTAKALAGLPDEEVVGALTSIAGIGAWTANVFLIFNLGRLDVMPASDRGIRRGVQLAYNLREIATPRQVQQKAELWRPYRSVASIYLWTAVKLSLSAVDLRGQSGHRQFGHSR
jgi:DNA-3-methyladenine glycosylase II